MGGSSNLFFAGSNADLPIVGGSYPDTRSCSQWKWLLLQRSFERLICQGRNCSVKPMSVIRLTSDSKGWFDLAENLAAASVLRSSVQVLAGRSDGAPHHCITDCVARSGSLVGLGLWEQADIVRSHLTAAYHPHKDVQHIKKENIGLIEVVGLAILPPLLRRKEVEQVTT